MKCMFLRSVLGLSFIGSAVAHDSGFYTGVGLKYSSFHSDVKISAAIPPDVGHKTLDIKKASGNIDLFAGYQKYFGDSFMGAELFVNPLTDTLKKTTINALVDDDTGNIMFQDIQLKSTRKYSLGARLKYGRHFDNRTAVFVSLGLLGSQFKTTHRDNSPQAINYQHFLFGYTPGIGIKYYLKKRLPITFQYNYEIYNKLSTKNMSLVATSDLRYKLTNTYHSFMISLSCEL